MRNYVRSWINEWDLRRLFPDYTPEIEAGEITFLYEEDADLEAPAASDGDDRERAEQ